jgi:hypothetical protein
MNCTEDFDRHPNLLVEPFPWLESAVWSCMVELLMWVAVADDQPARYLRPYGRS